MMTDKEEIQLQRAFCLQLIRASEAEAELARIKVREYDHKLQEIKMQEMKNPKKENDLKKQKEK